VSAFRRRKSSNGIQCEKIDLLQELSLSQGVVERKTTIPILGNILCEAAGNKVTLTATDLELSIRTSCEAKVEKRGFGNDPREETPRTGALAARR